jgi:hypothetical protein
VNLMIYGALFLVTILVLPRGIVPSLQQRWRTWMANRNTRPSSIVPTKQPDPVLVKKRR